MTDNANLHYFFSFIDSIDDSIIAGPDSAKSLEWSGQRPAVLVGTGLEALNSARELLPDRLIEFAPIAGSFVEELDLVRQFQCLSSAQGIRL